MYDRLKEQKDAKQEEWEEQHKFKNQMDHWKLDADDAAFEEVRVVLGFFYPTTCSTFFFVVLCPVIERYALSLRAISQSIHLSRCNGLSVPLCALRLRPLKVRRRRRGVRGGASHCFLPRLMQLFYLSLCSLSLDTIVSVPSCASHARPRWHCARVLVHLPCPNVLPQLPF